MKFKYALLVAIGLACFTHNAFAEPQVTVETIKQKAEEGNVMAQQALGVLYLFGEYGVEKDPFEAKNGLKKRLIKGM